MNERIRELLVEAREQTKEGKWHAPTAVWAEKFAELIIRECSNKIEDQKATAPPQVAAGLNFAQVIIKEHFGVEE